jgi:hypothetical protein
MRQKCPIGYGQNYFTLNIWFESRCVHKKKKHFARFESCNNNTNAQYQRIFSDTKRGLNAKITKINIDLWGVTYETAEGWRIVIMVTIVTINSDRMDRVRGLCIIT